MRVLRLSMAGFFLAFANLALAVPTPCTNFYPEDGDAGDRLTAPQNVTGGPWCGISGSIGKTVIVVGDPGPDLIVSDPVDAFKFYYTGGHFIGEYVSTESVTRELYFANNLVTPLSHTGDDWGTLPAGNYVFELTALVDPPFTFGLIIDLEANPNADPLPIRAPAPAPGPLALMLAGLGALAASRRRTTTV